MKNTAARLFCGIRSSHYTRAEREKLVQRVNRSRGGSSHSAADHKLRNVTGRKGKGK